MKIKYLFLTFIFSTLQLFSAKEKELLKVKFEEVTGGGRIIKDDNVITVSSVGQSIFDALMQFDSGVKAFRNATTKSKVQEASENIRKSLDAFVKAKESASNPKSIVYPYEIGKKVNNQLTGIFNALADIKKMPNREVGFEKTISSALIFDYILDKLKLKNNLKSGSYKCSGVPLSFDCVVLSKDSVNDASVMDFAAKSGNFFFIYWLELLRTGFDFTDKNLRTIFNDKLRKFPNGDYSPRGDMVQQSSPYYNAFSVAYVNFRKKTNSKSLLFENAVVKVKRFLEELRGG